MQESSYLEKMQAFHKSMFNGGLALNAYCFILFIIGYIGFPSRNPWGDDGLWLFLAAYIPVLAYFIALITFWRTNKRNESGLNSRRLKILFVGAFLINCYHLNLLLNLFSTFVTYANVLIGIQYFSFIALAFRDKMHEWLKIPIAFGLGLGLIFTLYEIIYLFPILPYGIPGLILIGMGMHIFIPLLLIQQSILGIKDLEVISPAMKSSFFAGVIAPILFFTFFLFSWFRSDHLIKNVNNAVLANPNTLYSSWIHLSQQWPDTWTGEKILMGSMGYEVPFTKSGMNALDGGWSDKKHDPMIALALLFTKDLDISRTDRIKILNAQFDKRHQTHRKLWTGENLSTEKVITKVDVFPDYRIAYIEKEIFIKNSMTRRWGTQQEALYTFDIPEGSVATSLSLWVNGVEEKSRLTTKSKADSAYVTIVGRERRDPALMHWQEGNKFTVTVFPCTPQEVRRFKIGLTIPLRLSDQQLDLANIAFEGPEAKNAEESTRIEIHHAKAGFIQKPRGFKKKNPQVLTKDGKYCNMWELTIDKPAINDNGYMFQDLSYTMHSMSQSLEDYNPINIFLDINDAWTTAEIDKLLKACKDKSIYVYQDKIIELTEKNKKSIIKDLRRYRFSIIPLNEIPAKAQTLFITKGIANAPNLKDLKGSKYEKAFQNYLDAIVNLKVYNIGNEVSPYLASLKGFKVIEMYKGNMDKLVELLKAKKFSKFDLPLGHIPIPESQVSIAAMNAPENGKYNGPDHLMRLHHFNKIMNQIGPEYFKSSDYPENGESVELAKSAHVLSPVSSMIVLETIKDYDRFDIQNSRNSIGNAAMKNSGSIPEPHEWLLIILALGAFILLKIKSRA